MATKKNLDELETQKMMEIIHQNYLAGRQEHEEKKEEKECNCALVIAIVVIAALLFALCVFGLESDSDQASRRSKECAAQGYNAIQAKYTKEGDTYFVCVNYDE